MSHLHSECKKLRAVSEYEELQLEAQKKRILCRESPNQRRGEEIARRRSTCTPWMRSKQRTNDRDVEENTNHQNTGTDLELENANGIFDLEMELISEKEK